MKGGLHMMLCLLVFIMSGYDDVTYAATTMPPVVRELDTDQLALMNLAAKGRIVELLANELARTEIIRALLVEYAKECVDNVTRLETRCLECVVDRCSNRFSECNLKVPQLAEVINVKPSPIQGLQFLSKAPEKVDQGMHEFAARAREDILRGIPESLRKEGETIMHTEVDESLKDLNDNIDTNKVLQTIEIHVQKAKNNIHLVPEVGAKVGEIIVENKDKVNNFAEMLAMKLRDARPVLVSINHHGSQIMENMPAIMEQVEQRVASFKDKMANVFQSAVGAFSAKMDQPDTPVVNGMAPGQQLRNPDMMGPNMNPNGNFAGPMRMPNMQQMQFNGRRPINQFNGMPRQVQQMPQGIQGQQWAGGVPNQGQFQSGAIPMQGLAGSGAQVQSFQGGQFQGLPGPQNVPAAQFQGGQPQRNSVQGIHFQNGQHGGQVQNMIPGNLAQGVRIQQSQGARMEDALPGNPMQDSSAQGPQWQQGSQGTQGQGVLPGTGVLGGPMQQEPQGVGGTGVSGRRRRQAAPGCEDIDRDPDTYCRKYEPQCHNCTLEKRLRFEVCGEGVEKARDEIKRLDMSVEGYLNAYDTHIAQNPVLLKVEINSKNRLHKSNSYYDAYVTAKIGPSIIRYKNKAVINLNDIRVSGSGIGDGIWEKLWENKVFEEAKSIEIHPEEPHELGQLHKFDVHAGHAHKGSAGCVTPPAVTLIMSLVSIFVVLV